MFCFVHIEKAAGSTLHNLFKYNMPGYISLFPWYYWSNEPNSYLSVNELKIIKRLIPNFMGFGGHTLKPFLNYEEIFDEKLNFILFLREPVSRYLSYYYYQNDKMGFERTIDEYLNESRFNNFITVRIAGRENLSLAKRIIDEKIDFIGLTSSFNESLILMNNSMFGNDLNIKYEVRNRSKERIKISMDDLNNSQRNKVLSNNELDLELYKYCQLKYEDQIRKFNGDLESELRSFEQSLKDYSYKKFRFNLVRIYKGYNRYLVEPIAHKFK